MCGPAPSPPASRSITSAEGMYRWASGWLAKGHRHLDDLPECPEQGMLWTIEATVLRYTGDLDGSIALAERAAGLARRLHLGNMHAMSIHTVGMALIESGDVPQGMRLLDEAMTSVLANELDAYLTGVVYCNVIGACLEVEDLRPGERVVGRGAGLVRLHRRRVPIPRVLQGQSCARGTSVGSVGRGGVGGCDRGRGAAAPRRRGRRVRPVGARRDPPSPRRPGRLGGRIRTGPGDGRRSTTRLCLAAVRKGSGSRSRRCPALCSGATAHRAAARPRVGGERRRRTGLRRPR